MSPAPARRRCRVTLVQQGVWDMPLESMPLAVGYLKAACLADGRIRDDADILIANFNGAERMGNMAAAVLVDPPDILGISVFGWNMRSALALGDSFKQINPSGWVVLGGTHVSEQGNQLLARHAQIDVVVNGEGERTFPEIVNEWLASQCIDTLAGVPGLTLRLSDGSLSTSPQRDRITELDTITSPVITGAIPLANAAGRFRYDVAIMETNRGCPYKCAFCYWGGAIGQRVRHFSIDRLAEELEIFAFYEVPTVVLCDANFGMQAADEEFLEAAIKIRERYGYPRAIETSWAKNKSGTFYRIVRRMKETGMRSSFTLALQTLNDETLRQMDRRNMKLNDWTDLVTWLEAEGLDCYAELIWGAPGETIESFVEGYDRLSEHVARIATYPLLLLPNTSYSERRSEHGFITVRGDQDDFEYVIANNDISLRDNLVMQRFLFWSRTIAENSVFRYVWRPLRLLADIKQSDVIKSLGSWFEKCDDPVGRQLPVPNGLVDAQHIAAGLRYIFGKRAVFDLFGRWWRDEIEHLIPPEHRLVLNEVFRLDLMTCPITDPAQYAGLKYVDDETSGSYYELPGVRFAVRVADVVDQLRHGTTLGPGISDCSVVTIRWKAGFLEYIDNHELALQYFGEIVRGPDQQECAED